MDEASGFCETLAPGRGRMILPLRSILLGDGLRRPGGSDRLAPGAVDRLRAPINTSIRFSTGNVPDTKLFAGGRMDPRYQPGGSSRRPEVSRRTLRLTFKSSEKGVELLTVERLEMITPPQPGESPEAGRH